jgi:hypothetical protein
MAFVFHAGPDIMLSYFLAFSYHVSGRSLIWLFLLFVAVCCQDVLEDSWQLNATDSSTRTLE